MSEYEGKPPTVSPHPDGEQLAEEAVERALRLASAVRDEGVEGVARITEDLTRDQLVALAVAACAMVPDDLTARQLLAWVDAPRLPHGQCFPPMRWSDSSLRMAHAAHTAGRRDWWATEGEAEYQLRRKGSGRRSGAVAS